MYKNISLFFPCQNQISFRVNQDSEIVRSDSTMIGGIIRKYFCPGISDSLFNFMVGMIIT